MIETIAVALICLCIFVEITYLKNLNNFFRKHNDVTLKDINKEFKTRCCTLFAIPIFTIVLELVLLFLKR